MHAPAPNLSTPLLRLDRVTKRFGAHAAVDDLSFDLAAGEFVCLLGPSGCGKSTLLRLIAGFERPDSGAILLGAEDLAALPPHRRPVNMMFQSYALFPHMSVERNVAYGLKGLGLTGSVIAERVKALLRLVRLEGFEARRPDKLSGGQRQRVALARALAREPKLLLLDEPLGALDRSLREETQGELRALQRRLGTSFVVVTHDPEEAMALSDRIGVMDRGRLVQVGTASALYERPATRYIAGLLGDVNLIEGRLGDGTVETALGPIRVADAGGLEQGERVVLAVRPERLILEGATSGARQPDEGQVPSPVRERDRVRGLPFPEEAYPSPQPSPARERGPVVPTELPGTVVDVAFLGDRIRRQVGMADGSILRVTQSLPSAVGAPAVGEAVRLVIPADAVRLLQA